MKTRSILAFALLAIAGCAQGPRDFSSAYREALSSRPGIVWDDASKARAAAEGFGLLYGDLSPDNVRARARKVYADNAWFNDTVGTEVGSESIERYLLKTAEGAESVHAEVQDVAISGADCYVRWKMEVRAKNLAAGQPIVTEGISQLRFDGDGRIIFHQDFWNPAAGIYSHLPLLGPAIRYVNGLIAPPH